MSAAMLTPGEWRAAEWNSHLATTVVTEIDGRTVVVAACAGHGRYADESVNDARLIAASKKLLDVAQRCAARLAAERWVTDGPRDALPPEAVLLLDLRAAIAQATTGSTA